MSKSKKKQFKKSEKAAIINFSNGFAAGVEAGKFSAAARVKLVMDTAASLMRDGLERYSAALMGELQADLREIAESADECDGCAECGQEERAAA